MITFYRIPSESPNIRKISLMLEELELPHVVKMIEHGDDGEFDAEFAAINPNGTVPAITDTDTDVTIFESGAILIYLAEKTGQLLPGDIKDRAQVIK